MRIIPGMEAVRIRASYIAASVHYNRRAADKKYEVIARLTDAEIDRLDLSIGGEVVLDVQSGRDDAMASVRFFRRQAAKHAGRAAGLDRDDLERGPRAPTRSLSS